MPREMSQTENVIKFNRIFKNFGKITKKCNTYVIGMTEGDERKEKELMSEVIMAENFPKAMTNTKAKIQEAQRTQSRYM